MKTTTNYHESYQPKQGFGARLLFYAFLLSIIGFSKAFAQAPTNDECPGAFVLTSDTICNYVSVSTIGATSSGNFICGGVPDDDVWFSFTATSTAHRISFIADLGDTTAVIFESCGGSSFDCRTFGGQSTSYNIDLTNCAIGSTVTFRLYNYGIGGGNFQICVTDLPPPTILSPLNGATINSLCDLQFCVYDSVGSNVGVHILDSNSNNIALGFLGVIPQSTSCMVAYMFSNDLLPGSHTFYLAIATNSVNVIVDSVTVNIANTIPTLQNQLTFTQSPSTNGGYDFTMSGFSPTETYTMVLHNYYNNQYDTLLVSNTTTATLSHQYPYNSNFYGDLIVKADCNGATSYDSINVTVNNSACSSFIALYYASVYFSNSNCGSSLVDLQVGGNYGNLMANDSSQLIINWGDGNTQTVQILHGSNTSGAYQFSPFSHQYSLPGTYTVILSLADVSACNLDTLVQSITIGSNTCGSLYGTIYSDVNTNCSLDNGTDLGLGNLLITATDNNSNVFYAWTDFNGNYAFNTLPNGTYVVDLGYLNSGYSLTCSNVFPQTITINNNSILVDCPVTCSGAFDAAITGISIWGALYPGQPEMILPYVGLLNGACNTTVTAGQVKIVLDACTQYTSPSTYSGAGAPDAIITAATGDTLIWNVADINNIGNFSYYDYAINILMCTTAQVGDSACITMIVEPLTGDADPTNNTYTRCFEIGVSYDPNNKEVQPTGVEAAGFIPADQPLLTYTLNFQNTGTAKAFNVYVMDTIDTDLDINSIEILSASHRMQVYTLPNRSVKFMFADIMLPDSTHDEPNSHGYVTFKIKVNQGLTPGTEIENTGHIYFDYNEPVVTNTTLNTIEFPSSVQTLGKSTVVKVFPNPAKESVTVVSNSNSAGQITITDLLGKIVKEVTITNEKTVVNTADLQSGVYFIKLTQNNVSKTEKIMIAK